MCCCINKERFHKVDLICAELGKKEQGQATIEAAVMLPVFFLVLLLMLQPGILLYDRLVMEGAASEACRLLATKTDAFGQMDDGCQVFVRRRLGAIPPLPIFHVHEPACSWDISLIGSERESEVDIRIAHEVRPLPLFDAGARVMGLTNDRGNYEIVVERCLPAYAPWVIEAADALEPNSWVGAWLQ